MQKAFSAAADSREPLNYEALKVTCFPTPRKILANSFHKNIAHSKASNHKETDTILIQRYHKEKKAEKSNKTYQQIKLLAEKCYNEMDGDGWQIFC